MFQSSPPPAVQPAAPEAISRDEHFLTISLPSGARAVLPKNSQHGIGIQSPAQDTTRVMLAVLLSPEASLAKEAVMRRFAAEGPTHSAKLGEILLSEDCQLPMRLAAVEVLKHIPLETSKEALRQGSSLKDPLGLACLGARVEMGQRDLAPELALRLCSNLSLTPDAQKIGAIRALNADLFSSAMGLRRVMLDPNLDMDARANACLILGMMRNRESHAALRDGLLLEQPLAIRSAIALSEYKDPAAKSILVGGFGCSEGDEFLKIKQAMARYDWTEAEVDICRLMPNQPFILNGSQVLALAECAPPLARKYIRELCFDDALALYEGLPYGAFDVKSPASAVQFVHKWIWEDFGSAELSLTMMRQLGSPYLRGVIADHYHRIFKGDAALAAQSLYRGAALADNPSDKRQLAAYASALTGASAGCLENPFRFSPELLMAIRNQPKNDPRPRGVIILARTDYNGAFYDLSPELERLTTFYHIDLFEAGSDAEMLANLRNSVGSTKGLPPAELIIIGGHGSETGVLLGDPDAEGLVSSKDAELDISDYKKLKAERFGSCLKPGGKLVLLSCSTGSGGTKAVNLVNALAALMPPGAEVIGPREPYFNANLTLVVSSEGKLVDVMYGGSSGPFSPQVPSYRALARELAPWRASLDFDPPSNEQKISE